MMFRNVNINVRFLKEKINSQQIKTFNMKKLVVLITTLIFCLSVFSQKASDVIENGIKIKSNNEIFIKFDGANILYQANETPNELNFKKIKDSAMLLPVDPNIIFYIRPLNPLNYAYKSETKIINDPIDEAASTALGSIIDFVGNMNKNNKETKHSEKVAEGLMMEEVTVHCPFDLWIKSFNEIADRLKKNQKEKIAATFKDLKNLDFTGEQNTINDLGKAELDYNSIVEYFSKTEEAIKIFKESIKNINCKDKSYEFIVKGYFEIAAKDLEGNLAEQKKRLKNLQEAYKVVRKAQVDASKLNWLAKVDDVTAEKGKIALVTVTINETGYKLSDDNEIIPAVTKEKTTKVLRVRGFQRFVPEVSVGIVHANLSFPKFGTNTDASDKQIVADAGDEKINRINISTMINYNLFISNSPLHPFWQIGIGLNTDFPTLLTGVGLRVNANGARRLAISVGLATTWIKTLNKLKLGDVVAGPAEVEKDTKFKFNTKPQPYFGIQYNF